jgi:hypothetical protein
MFLSVIFGAIDPKIIRIFMNQSIFKEICILLDTSHTFVIVKNNNILESIFP